MSRRIWASFLIAILGVVFSACASGPRDEGEPLHPPGSSSSSSGVRYTAPDGWIEETPVSAMRKGQYRLPAAEGDSEDAELAIFYFGPGQGGSIQANLDRWVGQFMKADGSPAHDVARVSEKQVHGKTVTILDVSGTYVPSMGPMMAAGAPQPNYRLLAAIVDTPSGPWFFKLTGPANTIKKWEASFDQLTESFQVD